MVFFVCCLVLFVNDCNIYIKDDIFKIDLSSFFRTPVDQISGSCVKDSRPLQTLSVHEAVTGEGEEDDDDDVDDLTGIIDFCLLNLTIKYFCLGLLLFHNKYKFCVCISES